MTPVKMSPFRKGNHLKQTSMCCRLGSTKSLVSFKHRIGSDLDDEFPCISQVPLLGSSCFFFCFWYIFGGVFVHLWKKKDPDIQIHEFSIYKSIPTISTMTFGGFLFMEFADRHTAHMSVSCSRLAPYHSLHRILYQQQPRPSSTSSTFLDFRKKITWKKTSWVRPVFLMIHGMFVGQRNL